MCGGAGVALGQTMAHIPSQVPDQGSSMLDLNFADPATNANPFPIFARLRAEDPG
jgi:hypothetical protein